MEWSPAFLKLLDDCNQEKVMQPAAYPYAHTDRALRRVTGDTELSVLMLAKSGDC